MLNLDLAMGQLKCLEEAKQHFDFLVIGIGLGKSRR